MRIELVKPSVEMEKLISELVFEFKEHNEDTINGCCGLTRCNDYNEWMHCHRVERVLGRIGFLQVYL